MSEPTVAEAIERVYEALKADNTDIDLHIATLRAAMANAGLKEAAFDPRGWCKTIGLAGS